MQANLQKNKNIMEDSKKSIFSHISINLVSI
jgi:hypothetical protein